MTGCATNQTTANDPGWALLIPFALAGLAFGIGGS